jgi:hypothetical protein
LLLKSATDVTHDSKCPRKTRKARNNQQKKNDKSLYLEKMTLKLRGFSCLSWTKSTSCLISENNTKIFKTTGHLDKFYKKSVQQAIEAP